MGEQIPTPTGRLGDGNAGERISKMLCCLSKIYNVQPEKDFRLPHCGDYSLSNSPKAKQRKNNICVCVRERVVIYTYIHI